MDVFEALKMDMGLLLLLTILLAAAFLYLRPKMRKSEIKLSSPRVAPAGYLETLKQFGGPNGPFFLLDMSRKMSCQIFRINLPPTGVYIVSNPKAAREILADKETDKPSSIYKAWESISGGPTLFTRKTNDKLWKSVRKGTAHAFASSQVRRMNQICSEHAERWISDRLEPMIVENKSFDPSKEMTRLVFGAVMESAFEYASSDEDFDFFSHHCEVALREFAKQTMNPFRKFYQMLNPSYNDVLRSCENLQAFVMKIINSYRNNPAKSDDDTVIKLILKNDDLSDKEKVSEILLFMIAGFDTTGYSLSSTLILLAKHPQVQKKLQQQLLSMDFDQRPKSSYLHCVIKESMRLIPVTAMSSFRVVKRDFHVQDGKDHKMVIPRNAIVCIPSILMMRDQSIFSDPDIFNPERWETNNKDMNEASMPFTAGSRNCPGQTLANAELHTTVVKLLSKYTFELETEGKLDFFLTLKYMGAKVRASRIA